MKGRQKIFSILLILILILSMLTNLNRLLVIALNVLLTLMVLDKLGRGIILRELIALHSAFICLLMPLVGYIYYGEDHLLSRIWVKYMLVPEDIYFGFTLPATAGFVLTLCWPSANRRWSDEGEPLKQLLSRSGNILRMVPKVGLYLMTIGVFSMMFSFILPVTVKFFFTLFFIAAFTGFLYIYFLPDFKSKTYVLLIFGTIIFINALQSGMFTVVAYMTITLVSFFFVGKKIKFWKKITVFIVGLFMTFTLQNVKLAYRKQTWLNEYEGNKATLFLKLISDQFKTNEGLSLEDAFFPIYTRGNQGFNITLVMRRIPLQQDFDGGEHLFVTIFSSFVPRVFWPDKPEAGGKFNMLYYAGFNIEGWSTNVGPLGEAYASFGVIGGIIYMTVLGAVIRWSYVLMFRISQKIPLLLFWLPVVFYQVTYSAESDTLQILNSIVKSGLFVWVLYRLLPLWFGIVKSPFLRKQPGNSFASNVHTLKSTTTASQ